MKRIAIFLTALLAIAAMSSCQKEQKPEFGILSENEFNVGNTGGFVTVIMHTNQPYAVTPSADWCHVVVKQPICFKLQVDENATLSARECTVTVESTDEFEPVLITVFQDEGQLFFRMDESEKTKTFPAEGQTQTVVMQTNMGDYQVKSSEDWCHVGNRTGEGFEVICDPRDDFGTRTAVLTLEMEGLDELEGVQTPVRITVSQKGNNMILNPVFANDSMDGWVSEPEGIFALNDAKWIPGDMGGVGHDIEINSGNGTGFPKPTAPFSGYFLYHVDNVTPGTWTFSFRSQRGSNSDFTMNAVLRNADGALTVNEPIELVSNWGTNSCIMTVTEEGAYDVGIYVEFSSNSPWFNLIDFKFE